MKKIFFFILALLYALLPIDIIPDVLVGWGWIDDLIILGLVLRYVLTGKVPSFINRKFFRFGQDSFQKRTSYQKRSHVDSDNTYDNLSPHEILGVPPTAGREEIRAAYRRLASQYHPDKVNHLGEEFRLLAEKKFKSIQGAYQKLTADK